MTGIPPQAITAATPLTPQIEAAAAIMDEIDHCRNPVPCDLCRQRIQSIIDIGGAAERANVENLRHALKEAGKEMDRRYEMGVAAERERCARLAERRGAFCARDAGQALHTVSTGTVQVWHDPPDVIPFADLLREAQP